MSTRPAGIPSHGLHCISIKSSPFYFCDNIPICNPLQITLGRNIAKKIWNKLKHGNFDIYLLCVASSHRKMTHFSQFHNAKILMSHFRQFAMMILSYKLFSSVCESLYMCYYFINCTWQVIDPLLTYSDTERALHGSRYSVWYWWFGVNTGFSDKDRILMKNV